MFLETHSHKKMEQSPTEDSIIREPYFESSDDGYAIMPNGAFISLVLGTRNIMLYFPTLVIKNVRVL